MAAERGPWAAVRADPRIRVTETGDGVALIPSSVPTGVGLVFLAGARVDPEAYAAKLAPLVDAGVTVVIARPTLNFAIIESRPLSTFTALAPGVRKWFVGGHSLGGVRACQYAHDDPSVGGLVLFGSYCSVDLSRSSLPVLSVAGSRDGLSTPAKIAANARLLPASARFVTIAGADHAMFGDYGAQPGDNTATISDAEMRRELTAAVLPFLG
ncbi:alpha/beta hydrolase [Galbitalea soli]|uniref:Alpha/beta hydrolase n=2 Tax=Galbitalea soli TaxID=1268042 RepID=A0A7C9TML3_9MICO|nr:alpha/beta hydrolase [Galbitalea soli]NEM89738.1 alpha/beta hydrolase [Galbitalea soli]